MKDDRGPGPGGASGPGDGERVIVPFGGEFLALGREDFERARLAGRAIMGGRAAKPDEPSAQIEDAEGMAKLTGIPATWFLEQARQAKIPHLRAGKYVRFRFAEVMAALAREPRHGAYATPSEIGRRVSLRGSKGYSGGSEPATTLLPFRTRKAASGKT